MLILAQLQALGVMFCRGAIHCAHPASIVPPAAGARERNGATKAFVLRTLPYHLSKSSPFSLTLNRAARMSEPSPSS